MRGARAEERESHRGAWALLAAALAVAGLAATLQVASAVRELASRARSIAASDAALAGPALDEARGMALLECAGGGAFASAVLVLGGALAVKLVRRERTRARAARGRQRLARLGTLATALASELRAPLDEARDGVEQLHERVAGDVPLPGVEASSQLCERALDSLARIEAALQSFVLSARAVPAAPRLVDVAWLVREWAHQLEPELSAHGVGIALEGEGPAPALADLDGFKRIFWVLVRNARDASPRGSLVRVGVACSAERVLVRVADLGPGIDRARREEVFEPFASTKPEGAGLGLAIARRLAESMGAKLSLRGGPPGAVFELSLRRAPHAFMAFGLPTAPVA